MFSLPKIQKVLSTKLGCTFLILDYLIMNEVIKIRQM